MLPPYAGEYGVKAEHDVPAATKMGASFTHVATTAYMVNGIIKVNE